MAQLIQSKTFFTDMLEITIEFNIAIKLFRRHEQFEQELAV